ncbi:MAG: hypothetical protein WCG73_02135 [Candidatus Moraniibacteriota bacterium]
MRIAFDLSRVIIRGEVKHTPNFIANGNVYLPDAAPTLLSIVARHGADQIFIFSCVKDDREEQTVRHWFVRHSFSLHTGILLENIHLCRRRSQKRDFCKQFHPDVIVDDRFEVLHHVAEDVPNLFLFQGREEEIQKKRNEPFRDLLHNRVTRVESWPELGASLLAA